MQTQVLLLLLLGLVSADFINEVRFQKNQLDGASNDNQCDAIQYERPEIFYVQGTAEFCVPPTMAFINLGVEVKHKIADEALTRVASIVDSATNSLKGTDTSNAQMRITTNGFSLQPHVEQKYNPSTQNYEVTFQGYRVFTNLLVETNNLQIVGKLIDAAVKQGVTSVYEVRFDITPEAKAELRDKLLEGAIKSAKHKADITLRSIGMKIRSLKSINIEDTRVPRVANANYYGKEMAMDAGAPATQIFAEDQKLTQSVTLGYVIMKDE